MDNRNIRIGNWICDASNFNYELRAGINELQYANIFVPIPIETRFLGGFKPEEVAGKIVYYREEGTRCATLEDLGGKWMLSIHTQFAKFEGTIRFVHELQNFLSDCQIYWDIKCDYGEKP